jgi:hypothetical protein
MFLESHELVYPAMTTLKCNGKILLYALNLFGFKLTI